MTKKHFKALAEYIKYHLTFSDAFNSSSIEALANFCLSQNLKFNKKKWLKYIYGK